MKLYQFKSLIRKYSVPFCLHISQGGYVAGKWEQGGERVEEMQGAIVPISAKKLYEYGGTYTAQDRELYVTKPLKEPLSDLKVVYQGKAYTVEEGRNFEEYADAAVYTLRYVSQAVMEHD